MRVGQGAELSVLNTQWANTGKSNKGVVATSQPPRGTTNTEQRSGESQRLRARDRERGEREQRRWDKKSTSQSRASGTSWSWSSGTEGNTRNWIAPSCWGSWTNRVAAVWQSSCCLVKTTVLTTLHELLVSYLSSQLQFALWTERNKYYSQTSHLVRPHQSSCLYANIRTGRLRNNSRTFTKRMNFLLFLYLVFLFFFFLYY
jgi:hypothetical protein